MEQGGAPNFELPPQPAAPEGETRQEQSVEAPPAQPEQAGKQAKAPALPKVPHDIPAVDKPVVAAPPQDVKPSDPHATAADTERIEPVWVNRVKDIESHTVDDPHKRSVEMNKVKTEYKLQRFNKQAKTDEAAA